MLAEKIEKETVRLGTVSPSGVRPSSQPPASNHLLPQAGDQETVCGAVPAAGGAPETDPCVRSDPSKSSTVPWTTLSGSWLGCRRRQRLSNS